MNAYRNLAGFVFLIFSFTFPKTTFPATLIFAYPALSGAQSIYWIAYEHGLFKHNTGLGIWYACAGLFAVKQAEKTGIGTKIDDNMYLEDLRP